ncbi:AAA family ATPase [Parablautia muri]|uniref:UDP-N-acetylglucosamine kinase n=1 Tax=Parablautia muri TaxID=2320879 RepID=A0A9X5BIM5_9FIRM|nr:AAA family ATPase [Parablautia muri]NBJ94655.1 hypothetical protein [Parablautia muri]
MYCILVAGIPAAGKSTMAEAIGKRFKLPAISKDTIKELLFDFVGFESRKEKVNLGIASMEIMYYLAEQLMKAGRSFILENNFEYTSKNGIKTLLEKYQYAALTVTLTGDYKVIHQRLQKRDMSPARHRGHVVNDCYPEKKERSFEELKAASVSYDDYVHGIENRGFDAFFIGNKRIKVDTTDFSRVDMEKLFSEISTWSQQYCYPPSQNI